MPTENAYDVVVIGSGTGGYVAAIRAAQLGLRTAVVERAPTLGGTCLNWGCIPTKALLEHAHALKVAQEWKDWGLTLGQAAIGIDMAQVQTRKDKIVKGLTGGIELLFKKNKIDWIKGSGRLAGKGRVEVTDGQAQMLSATREIIVATGSQPRSVPGIEIDRKRIITSDEAIGLKEIPKSIVILGSGAVGVEFASIFRRFGSEVTIVELLPRLVPIEDDAVSAELEKSFKRQGIKVLTGTKVSSAKVGANSGRDRGADARRDRDAARGRIPARRDRPRSGDGGPRAPRKPGCGSSAATSTSTRASRPACLAFPRSATSSRSTRPAIRSSRTSRRPRASCSPSASPEQESRPINYDQVPGCTYCDPEIGSVGLTEREARERGYDVRIGTFKFGVLARARIANEIEGFVKIVADRKYDEILGVHMIGPRATELVAEATLALRLECTVEELIRTIHAHPTMSEAVGEAAHAVHGAAIHA